MTGWMATSDSQNRVDDDDHEYLLQYKRLKRKRGGEAREPDPAPGRRPKELNLLVDDLGVYKVKKVDLCNYTLDLYGRD